MRLRIKMLGVLVYALIATTAVLTSNAMMADADEPAPKMAGSECPLGHLKG